MHQLHLLLTIIATQYYFSTIFVAKLRRRYSGDQPRLNITTICSKFPRPILLKMPRLFRIH